MPVNIIRCKQPEDVERELAKLLQDASDQVTDDHKLFSVGLSGGSLPKLLSKILPTLTTNWKKWRFFFCDERVVPFSDPESTFGMYKKILFDDVPAAQRIPMSLNQFVTIDPSMSISDCAYDYQSKLRTQFNKDSPNDLPRFDLLLLGMGPDGHTCSLFPNHPLLKEDKRWVSYLTDSPKPPPTRVTLTYPVINNSKRCVFVATGANKAQALREIFVEKKSLPAAHVHPTKGDLYWIVDSDAASGIGDDYLRRNSLVVA